MFPHGWPFIGASLEYFAVFPAWGSLFGLPTAAMTIDRFT
jgi:hypothetical protein